MNNVATKKYIRMIKKAIPLAYKKRSNIINDIKLDLEEYAENNNLVTYEELIQEFGKPENVVNEYMRETVSGEEINKIRKYYLKTGIIFASVVLGVVYAFVIFFSNKYSEKNNDMYCIENNQNEGFSSSLSWESCGAQYTIILNY